MTANEVRDGFLKFFEQRGHRIVPSASVIPSDDPTLLFTNAGMNQFKDVFLGSGKREYARAVDSQKCIRVSGKHNDLEEVGRDTYHHTFFEMLGNWSFGDYYKKGAIEWAWELLTHTWGLDKTRLYATVYESDEEAEKFWKKVTDIAPSHVLRFGKKDNFWEMGETGPCGPCSEIHIDLTPDRSGMERVNQGDPRVMEIWNLVFIQYDRDLQGTLTPLPAKHVDTGMGFERITAVLQGKRSNYDTELFRPIIRRIETLTGKQYNGDLDNPLTIAQSGIDIAMRVLADHIRMLSFAIADGGLPSNEGRGYVMRRILRRASRFCRTLDMHDPFVHTLVGSVVESLGGHYPALRERQPHIEHVIRSEEERFNVTLDRGIEIFESVAQKLGDSKVFPGEEAFKLYDTYGFPLDLTQLMAQERGVRVGIERFNTLMEEQRERARIPVTVEEISSQVVNVAAGESKFVGYEHDECETGIVELQEDVAVDYVVLEKTPFYTEAGGQVADLGQLELVSSGRQILVPKVFRTPGGAIVHAVPKTEKLSRGMTVKARVDAPRRRSIEKNHTATHIVHEALRRVLGGHLQQQGSLVDQDHLRFDFNHFEKITTDQLRAIEDVVNGKIAEAITVSAFNDPKDWVTIEEAKRRFPTVKMFFGEKYGEKVRVVEVDPEFSVELCGGTHVKNTREIGLFKIISEGSVASGIRRIEAVTGEGLKNYIARQLERIGEIDVQIEKLIREEEELAKELRQYNEPVTVTKPSLERIYLPTGTLRNETVDQITDSLRLREEAAEHSAKSVMDLRKKLSRYRVSEAAGDIESLASGGVLVEGCRIVTARVDANDIEELKSLGDSLRAKLRAGVGVFGAVIDGKVALVCVVTDDLIKEKKLQAGKIVGEIAKLTGGGGGGRPHLATAGGKDVAKLDEALGQTAGIIFSMLKR